MMTKGTIAQNSVDTPKINLNDLNNQVQKIESDHRSRLIAGFMGVEVKVDHTLEGLSYYISVSPELHNLLKQAPGANERGQAPKAHELGQFNGKIQQS